MDTLKIQTQVNAWLAPQQLLIVSLAILPEVILVNCAAADICFMEALAKVVQPQIQIVLPARLQIKTNVTSVLLATLQILKGNIGHGLLIIQILLFVKRVPLMHKTVQPVQ